MEWILQISHSNTPNIELNAFDFDYDNDIADTLKILVYLNRSKIKI